MSPKEVVDSMSRCPIRVWLGIAGTLALAVGCWTLLHIHEYAVKHAVLETRVSAIERIADDVQVIKMMLIEDKRERGNK